MEIAGYDIRFSEPEDLSHLNSLFSMPVGCGGFPFYMEEKEEVLKNWIGWSKYKASLTGTIHGIPCAIGSLFLGPYRKVAHHCPFYLVVQEDKRRQGIGTSMVRNLLHLAKNRFRLESVHVEIFPPNDLLSIVKKLGFQQFAEQADYVQVGPSFRPRILLEHFFA